MRQLFQRLSIKLLIIYPALTLVVAYAISGNCQAPSGDTQDVLDLDIEHGSPFDPYSLEYCKEQASKNRMKCWDAAKSTHVDPKALDDALWECWFKWQEEIWFDCMCKGRLVMYRWCGDSPRSKCRQEYFRCHFRAKRDFTICLLLGGARFTCEDSYAAEEKKCEQIDLACVRRLEEEEKKNATILR